MLVEELYSHTKYNCPADLPPNVSEALVPFAEPPLSVPSLDFPVNLPIRAVASANVRVPFTKTLYPFVSKSQLELIVRLL